MVERDALLDRLGACAEAPECFHQRIGQVAVSAPDNDRALGPALFGKCVGDIVLGAVAAPMHDVKGDEIHQRAKGVQQRQGNASQRLEEKLHRDQATATSRSSVSGCFSSSSLGER